jgi:hypothetical protein
MHEALHILEWRYRWKKQRRSGGRYYRDMRKVAARRRRRRARIIKQRQRILTTATYILTTATYIHTYIPLRNGALVVTENGHLPIGIVVEFNLFVHQQAGVHILGKLLLERDRCIVRTEHFGRETRHQRFEVRIQMCRVHLSSG